MDGAQPWKPQAALKSCWGLLVARDCTLLHTMRFLKSLEADHAGLWLSTGLAWHDGQLAGNQVLVSTLPYLAAPS